MSNMNFDELLKIAKDSIIYFFKNHNFPNIEDHSEKKATFVTLEKNGELRGCIGEIFPVLPIKKSVSRNAINAAFYDPRFFPLTPEETKDLTIEISVLSQLKKFEMDYYEFLEFIEKHKPGVYITYNGYSATFLPDVWEQISDPNQFMLELCLKAGINPKYLPFIEKYYYFTEKAKKRWDEI
jgi:AmmeMemoRadiSam system protein A